MGDYDAPLEVVTRQQVEMWRAGMRASIDDLASDMLTAVEDRRHVLMWSWPLNRCKKFLANGIYIGSEDIPCDACRKPVRVKDVTVIGMIGTTSLRGHSGCLNPLVGKDGELENLLLHKPLSEKELDTLRRLTARHETTKSVPS